MSRRKVIVKRLAAIHDLGAHDRAVHGQDGHADRRPKSGWTAASTPTVKTIPAPARLAAVAADLGGDRGALDAALVAGLPGAAQGWSLAGGAPSTLPRTGSMLATVPKAMLLIVKGAPEAVVALCTTGAWGGPGDLDVAGGPRCGARSRASRRWLRRIAVASRPWTGRATRSTADDERGLVFEGLCAFADPPKATARAAIARPGGGRHSAEDPVRRRSGGR